MEENLSQDTNRVENPKLRVAGLVDLDSSQASQGFGPFDARKMMAETFFDEDDLLDAVMSSPIFVGNKTSVVGGTESGLIIQGEV